MRGASLDPDALCGQQEVFSLLTSAGPNGLDPTSKPVDRLIERLRDSLWIAWTFTLFFNWIAFFWVGFRARNGRWVAWGLVYAIPFVALMALSESDELYDSWPGDVAAGAWLILDLASIIHAFVIRRVYIAKRRALLARPLALSRQQMGGAKRTARSVGVLALYVAVGLVVGAIVLVVALFSDPCLPSCVAPADYVRGQILTGIAIAGALAYLALLVPMIWSWSTSRVWWLASVGGIGIGALALVSMWVTITHTGNPAFCHC